MKINSHGSTASGSRVFQQPTRLILTDVCKQSTEQPVRLSSTSDARWPWAALWLGFFLLLPLRLIHVIHVFHYCTTNHSPHFLWRCKSWRQNCDVTTILVHTGPDCAKEKERRKQRVMFTDSDCSMYCIFSYIYMYENRTKGRNTKLLLLYCKHTISWMYLWAVCFCFFLNQYKIINYAKFHTLGLKRNTSYQIKMSLIYG